MINTLVAHPGDGTHARALAEQRGLNIFWNLEVPRGTMFEVDSNTYVTQDLRTGEIRKPYSVAAVLGEYEIVADTGAASELEPQGRAVTWHKQQPEAQDAP